MPRLRRGSCHRSGYPKDAVPRVGSAEAERPDEVPAADWLRFEQEKHQRLLAAVAATT